MRESITRNVVLTPLSLPQWFQAFALRTSSIEGTVVQKPEYHRDKLGGVVCLKTIPKAQSLAGLFVVRLLCAFVPLWFTALVEIPCRLLLQD